MSVRMLSKEEIGLVSSFIDFDIVKALLNKMYDYEEANEDEHANVSMWNNRRKLAMWLVRANSIAVHNRYGRWLPAPTELMFYAAPYRKGSDREYKNAISNFLYQINEVEKDVVVGLVKSALVEQSKRLKIEQ